MTDEITGKNVLVTGGAGFIGSHIVDRLILEHPFCKQYRTQARASSPFGFTPNISLERGLRMFEEWLNHV